MSIVHMLRDWLVGKDRPQSEILKGCFFPRSVMFAFCVKLIMPNQQHGKPVHRINQSGPGKEKKKQAGKYQQQEVEGVETKCFLHSIHITRAFNAQGQACFLSIPFRI